MLSHQTAYQQNVNTTPHCEMNVVGGQVIRENSLSFYHCTARAPSIQDIIGSVCTYGEGGTLITPEEWEDWSSNTSLQCERCRVFLIESFWVYQYNFSY